MGLRKIVVVILFTAVLMIVIPNLPPDIEPTQFNIKPPRQIPLGWFDTNTILDDAELYYAQENAGYESIAIEDDNTIYSGDQLGNIIKITGKQVATNITTLKFPCNSVNSLGAEKGGDACGWPLGMRLYKGHLHTMDYYGGYTKINVKTGMYKSLIPKSRPIQGKFAHVPEDHDIDSNGNVYWTDGSTNGDFFLEMIGEPSGRLIKYDPVKRKNKVLLENLYFSNGVCLSDDETFVLVAESGRARILRYHISGDKKGKTDIFVDSLPGYPENIRSNGRTGFYVALFAPWNDEYSMKVHLLAPRPILRKLILRSRHLLLNMLRFAKQFLFENIYLDVLEKYVALNEPILNLSKIPKTATVVELSKSGQIIGILNGKSGKVNRLSEISVGTNFAFLVSPFESKIWRIKLSTLRRMY